MRYYDEICCLGNFFEDNDWDWKLGLYGQGQGYCYVCPWFLCYIMPLILSIPSSTIKHVGVLITFNDISSFSYFVLTFCEQNNCW
jgi:hypothetical protein